MRQLIEERNKSIAQIVKNENKYLSKVRTKNEELALKKL